ncbi:hypothetical protein PENSPDRAFT_293702 [Peniophora sp. CONT]|nr:hypothetical protein PENSPDRAFT_293702 [Peniophora sp. CONT]
MHLSLVCVCVSRPNFLQYLVKIATDTDRAHREMTNDPELSAVYFRADVPGLGDINLADISQGNFLQSETRKWLDVDGKATIDACVKRIKSQTIPCFELKPPPFGKPVCVGRTDIVDELCKVVSSATATEGEFTPRSVVIQGYLGIGKSTVALQVVKDARVKAAYKTRICYLRCDGILDIASLKSKLLAMRSIDGGKATDDDIRQLLSAAPTLVCLDNFEHLWNAPSGIRDALVEEFLPLIASNASLIVTVRGIENIDLNITGGWSSRTTLAPLDPSAARVAFLLHAKEQEPADTKQGAALDTLVDKCDGHPLTISLLAHLAGVRTFVDIVEKLSEDKDDAIANELDSSAHTGGLGASVLLSVNDLVLHNKRSALALCYVLSLLPDGASLDFLKSGLIDTKSAIMDARATLIQRGLAYEEPAYKFLRMLGPLRMFFEGLEPGERTAYGIDTPKLNGAVRDFHYALAQQSIFHCEENLSRRLLFAQTRNVEAAVTRDLDDTSRDKSTFAAVVNAACGVSGWYGWGGVPHAAPYLLKALETARTSGDPVLISQLLLEIGRDLADEDGERAIETFTEAYDVCMKYVAEYVDKDENEVDNRAVLYECAAIASEERATLASAADDLESAQGWVEEAINAYDALGNGQGRLNALIVLSGIRAKRGETESAVSSYETALELAASRQDRIGQVNICRSLAELVPKAEDKVGLLERAAALCDGLEWSDDAAECRLAIEGLKAIA